MANQLTAKEKEERRTKVALPNLKGGIPALFFSFVTGTDERHYGIEGLGLGTDVYMKYLSGNPDAQNFVSAEHLKSAQEARRMGMSYSGQVSDARLIQKAAATVHASIDALKLSDLAELKLVDNTKIPANLKNQYIEDLNEEGASKEYKALYKQIHSHIQQTYIEKYMAEALNDKTARSKSGLEEALANS